jgi:hypothetical protein
MARSALIFAFLFATGVPAAAQEALPDTPPELRDFRLDPERAQPQANPEPQPDVAPPPAVPTQPQTLPPSSAQPQPTPRQRSAPATSRDALPANEQFSEPAPSAETPSAEVEQAAAPDIASAEPDVAASPEPPIDSLMWWQIVAVAVFAALALFAFMFLRGRRKSPSQARSPLTEATEPETIAPAPPIMQTAAIVPPPSPTARAKLTLEFIPDTATLSFTALTIKGQLRLTNIGEVQARNMRLRATLLSANRQQEQMLAAFHSGAIEVPEELLGEAKVGERLAMQIEMSMPAAELQCFEVQSRRIMVPVMVANLAYDWVGGSDMVKLACLVGKEAEPPAPKMAPFRLDLGPRSFAPLGQRPLYT